MKILAFAILALQGVVMLIDELHFHRRRSLPRWERIGHPVDTASVLCCCLITLFYEPTRDALVVYGALGLASCVLVTKDEFVHAAACEPAEHWLHALLFVLHPLLLIALGLLWVGNARHILLLQTLATAAFGLYQLVYWNLVAAPEARPSRTARLHQE